MGLPWLEVVAPPRVVTVTLPRVAVVVAPSQVAVGAAVVAAFQGVEGLVRPEGVAQELPEGVVGVPMAVGGCLHPGHHH